MKKKILMALMGLEIGGAETHVVELSRALRRQGYEIVVISNGGVYEKELVQDGIRCYHAPLHRRSAVTMLQSLLRLRRVIATEKPDVVHAHARIPGFLCGILQRVMHFPFVTSAHWVFKVTPSLRRMTDWGEQTVAVSEDIRDYLIREYDLPAEQIRVTINGIDTEKFSSAVSGARVREEFCIPADAPVISYVSRMDESRALVARQLLTIAPRLREAIPNVRILIAGGGDVFDELSVRAKKLNREAGENYVFMPGARTDINEIVAAGDVFVGVSRAALEAMAAEKAVIVAGNEGYLGIFDESRTELAKQSNFCCRGCEDATPQRLYDDLLELFARGAAERAALGRFGRELICADYSVDRMANDCADAYRAACLAHTRMLVSGYYGYRNLGDDAILLSLKEQVQQRFPGAKLTVLSRRPRETREKYGVEAVGRFNPLAAFAALRRSACLISGGGSLMQDHTSTRSLLYYTIMVRFAKKLGKPVLFYANGIGPVTLDKNRRRVVRACEAADIITLRDRASLEELQAMHVLHPRLAVTADPIYAVRGDGREEGLACLREAGIPTNRPIIGVSVRMARKLETDYTEFAAFCDRASQRGTIVFLVMQEGEDAMAAQEVRSRMRVASYLLSTPYQPRRMMAAISQMDAVVSTRLHSLIFAACERVPAMGIVYDPKVAACLREIGMPSGGEPDHFNAQTAWEILNELLTEREANCAALDEAVKKLSARAEGNALALEALLAD